MSEEPAAPDASEPHLVEDDASLEALAGRIGRESIVALDIEANGMHAYRERACVLQLTAGGESAIVDVVAVPDLDPLRQALDRDDVEVVFHGGDYDVSLLSRDHGFRFHGVFDTMIAATLLGQEKLGLADLVRDAYGVELDKRFQTVDWARRPLSDEQLDYLHRDTVYLPGLRDRYRMRLEEADLCEEADIEFRRLAGRQGKEPTFDPDGWRRMKGTNGLDARSRAILHALHAWRDEQARGRDRPPFKILGPRQMVELARETPRNVQGPQDLGGLPPALRRRYGRALVDVVRRASAAAERGEAPPKSIRPRPTPEEIRASREIRRLEDALRDWRREEATRRGVPNMVVLPNRALGDIVRNPPDDVKALRDHPDVGAKRAERYGEAILETLAREAGEDRGS